MCKYEHVYNLINENGLHQYKSIVTRFTVMHVQSVVLLCRKPLLFNVSPVRSSGGVNLVLLTPIMVQHGDRRRDFSSQERINPENRLPIAYTYGTV